MSAEKNVGEPCAGEPHARFEVAVGGNQASRAHTAARPRRLPPTLPTTIYTNDLTVPALGGVYTEVPCPPMSSIVAASRRSGCREAMRSELKNPDALLPWVEIRNRYLDHQHRTLHMTF